MVIDDNYSVIPQIHKKTIDRIVYWIGRLQKK